MSSAAASGSPALRWPFPWLVGLWSTRQYRLRFCVLGCCFGVSRGPLLRQPHPKFRAPSMTDGHVLSVGGGRSVVVLSDDLLQFRGTMAGFEFPPGCRRTSKPDFLHNREDRVNESPALLIGSLSNVFDVSPVQQPTQPFGGEPPTCLTVWCTAFNIPSFG